MIDTLKKYDYEMRIRLLVAELEYQARYNDDAEIQSLALSLMAITSKREYEKMLKKTE
jgi:hypothetical protein